MNTLFKKGAAPKTVPSVWAFRSLEALKAAPEAADWLPVLEHSATKEATWIQVVLGPEPVWVYAGSSITARYGIDTSSRELEAWRKAGHALGQLASSRKWSQVQTRFPDGPDLHLALLEGLVLSNYRFDKYLSSARSKDAALPLQVYPVGVDKKALAEMYRLTEAVCMARDWVNEPQAYMDAARLASVFKEQGKKHGFKVEVWNKSRIEKAGMGGLLAVNQGSVKPPTFTVMEYKPERPVNDKPVVLVGKGVVYDTGGLSLKPTPGSMDSMKCDMAGAAAVGAALSVVAANGLPVHVVGLVPATDNRPGGDAYTPGDIVRISDGTSVEVLNTDAEGRLILADALHYAKRYNPELVIDLATLTGSAVMALGSCATPCMGTATAEVVEELIQAGLRCYERLVPLPVWEEYGEMIKSPVADLKNIGGREAGAITAAKFLEHFTDYPWVHLDIAGPAFLDAESSYRGRHGTGHGVRLLYEFLKARSTR